MSRKIANSGQAGKQLALKYYTILATRRYKYFGSQLPKPSHHRLTCSCYYEVFLSLRSATYRQRVSSQRGRGGVELRAPKQEQAVAPEDRHKFIHDGEEYNRAPNLFDVGDGEFKLLPEVLSDLSFESRDFVDDGTAAEKKALRDSRPWGRLYVDGWPAPIQYLRSHFGGPAVEGMRPLVLADPLDACGPLRNADAAGIVSCRSRETKT